MEENRINPIVSEEKLMKAVERLERKFVEGDTVRCVIGQKDDSERVYAEIQPIIDLYDLGLEDGAGAAAYRTVGNRDLRPGLIISREIREEMEEEIRGDARGNPSIAIPLLVERFAGSLEHGSLASVTAQLNFDKFYLLFKGKRKGNGQIPFSESLQSKGNSPIVSADDPRMLDVIASGFLTQKPFDMDDNNTRKVLCVRDIGQVCREAGDGWVKREIASHKEAVQVMERRRKVLQSKPREIREEIVKVLRGNVMDDTDEVQDLVTRGLLTQQEAEILES